MKRALIVGIDHYPKSALHGCVNDATEIYRLLSRNEDKTPNFDCKLMVSSEKEITRKTLSEQIEELFRNPADAALLYFSGHGTVNLNSGYLVTQDAEKYSEGVSMETILNLANQSPIPEIMILLDCCYSGQLGNIPNVIQNTAILKEGISILTASRNNQMSVEKNGNGVFTKIVINALEGEAADILGNVTVTRVYDHLDSLLNAWEQRPMLKAHLSRRVLLRNCHPKIPIPVLQNLTKYFPISDYLYPLDSCYEWTMPCADPTKVRIFKELQKLRAKDIIEPIGEDDMYWAALNNKACQLTPLGKFYWKMAEKKKI